MSEEFDCSLGKGNVKLEYNAGIQLIDYMTMNERLQRAKEIKTLLRGKYSPERK